MIAPLNFPDFSVVIPIYNEEKGILETLRRAESFLSQKKIRWELILVNDGSTDGTERLIREALERKPGPSESAADCGSVRLISSEKNRGKGFAARQGMLATRGKYILITDADLSAPMKESDKLVRALEEGADVAVGSRAVKEPGCDVQQSLKRRLGGRVFNFFVRALALRGVRDTQCGFKCFKKEAAHFLFGRQKLDGFCFDVEVLYLARQNGLKIKEVPVMWRQGLSSRVRFFRDSIIMIKDLVVIRKLHPPAKGS